MIARALERWRDALPGDTVGAYVIDFLSE